MSNNKQSSVEFLKERIKVTNKEVYAELFEDIEQAEAMHREEIVNAVDGFPIHARHLNGEEYYNEHYGNTNRN